MLDRNETADTVIQFTVTIEIDKKRILPEKVRQRLGDATLYMEGIGNVDVDYLGELLPAESASE